MVGTVVVNWTLRRCRCCVGAPRSMRVPVSTSRTGVERGFGPGQPALPRTLLTKINPAARAGTSIDSAESP